MVLQPATRGLDVGTGVPPPGRRRRSAPPGQRGGRGDEPPGDRPATRPNRRSWGRARMTDVPGRPSGLAPEIAARLKRDANGLIVAVVQQYDTGEVLMVGWMDDEALHRTLTTGRTTFWSRSRRTYWVKGETSGHRQWVKEVRLDCDGDTVLVRVDQEGPACHTGARTCFDQGLLDVEGNA